MAAARLTMYRPEIVEEVRRNLRSLPEKPKSDELSKLEVVRALVNDIEELQKLGHSIQSIAATISESGVSLSKATLKTYLGKISPRRPRRQRGRRPARGSSPTHLATRGSDAVRAAGTQPVTSDAPGCDQKERSPAIPAPMLRGMDSSTPAKLEETSPETSKATPETTKVEGKEKALATRPVDRGATRMQMESQLGELTRPPSSEEREGNAMDNAQEHHAVNAPVMLSPVLGMTKELPRADTGRHGRENAKEALGSVAADGKEKASATRATVAEAKESAAAETRRGTTREIDDRKWTFVPREDSRDI